MKESVSETHAPPVVLQACGPDEMMSFNSPYESWLNQMAEASPHLFHAIKSASDVEQARKAVFHALQEEEWRLLEDENSLLPLERILARDCIQALKNIISPIFEKKTGVCSLKVLWGFIRRSSDITPEKSVKPGFLLEFIHLFRGISGRSGLYPRTAEGLPAEPAFLRLKGRPAAIARGSMLDEMAGNMNRFMSRYLSGLDPTLVAEREQNRRRILDFFGAAPQDWQDHHWQTAHVIRDPDTLLALVRLTPSQIEALKIAWDKQIPFGITPYYLSLMHQQLNSEYDHAIRAQVLPPLEYARAMAESRIDRSRACDFMREQDTSPVDLVTRRYPCIAILKPFNTCAQICVYCQRNWEIDQVLDPNAMASQESIQAALDWFDEHPEIGEVLVTGGDPLLMKDEELDYILAALAAKPHIFRIRLGTRTPVVLPMRWTVQLVSIIGKYHEPGRREVAIMTHFEHSAEITPDCMNAVQAITRTGIRVYNQEVFTIENSRRFETSKLRRDLRLIGVDPYYTFNMKGKAETGRFIVPIARILQERREEARLMPGLDRTDEPVFNVPRLGKNHLRSGQDHRLVMIRPDGARIYEFHPWENNLAPIPPYYYVDRPICDYLQRLAERGEDPMEYESIWYYV